MKFAAKCRHDLPIGSDCRGCFDDIWVSLIAGRLECILRALGTQIIDTKTGETQEF